MADFQKETMPIFVVHDSQLRIAGVIDNNKPDTLHYIDESWERDLPTGASVLTFSVNKRQLTYNETLQNPYSLLKERSWISFQYKGETFLFLIYKIKESREKLSVECRNLNLELIHEYAKPYKSEKPLTFTEYAKNMGLTTFTKLEIGANEISTYKRTLEFSSSETKLARLLALAAGFNAEVEFKTYLKPTGDIKGFILNIYKENDGEAQGVGKRRSDKILIGERDLKGITRIIDFDGLYNMLVPTSTDSEKPETVKSDTRGMVITKTKNSDGSITRKTVWKNSDGSTSTSITTTKVVKNKDGSSTTTKTTNKADGSITKTVTERTAKGNTNSTTTVLKAATTTKDTGEKEIIDLSELPDWEVQNEKGQVEFYKKGSNLYAPLSAQLYPSAFTIKTQNDQWIRRDISYTAKSSEELEKLAFNDLKNAAYPAVTYEVDGWTDLDIGDRIVIQDSSFTPMLIIMVRVTKQVICFTKPENSKTTYDNAKALQNRLSASIQARLAALVEAAKPYAIKFSADNGVTFKNNTGQSTITATLQKGGKDVDAAWEWQVNDDVLSSTDKVTISASGFEKTLIVDVIAYVGGEVVAKDQLTFTNVNDGAGVKKVTPYYASSTDGEAMGEWSTDAKPTTKSEPYVVGKYVTELTDGTVIETNSFVAQQRSPEFDELEASLNQEAKDREAALADVRRDYEAAQADIQSTLNDVAETTEQIKQDAANEISRAMAKEAELLNSVNVAKSDIATVSQNLDDAKDSLQAQAAKQEELSKLTSETKQLADGQITTISELSKTVAQNSKDVASVQSRTKTVEDTLSGTRITLEQVKATAETIKSNLADYKLSNDNAVLKLQQSLKDTDGNVSDLTTSINAVPGKISAAVKEVEGKIPTSVGGRNILRGTEEMTIGSGTWSTGTWRKSGTGKMEQVTVTDSPIPSISKGIKLTSTNASAEVGCTQDVYQLLSGNYTQSVWVKGSSGAKVRIQPFFNNSRHSGTKYLTLNGSWQRLAMTATNSTSDNYSIGYVYLTTSAVGSTATIVANYMDASDIISDWTPAHEDTAEAISSVSADLKLTKEGLTTYATKTEVSSAWSTANDAKKKANDNAETITNHTSQLSVLNNKISATVSTSTFDNLAGRVSSAESAIEVNAGELSKRLTSTQVEQAITAKGYQTKAQVDSNIAGRGLIKASDVDSKLQSYVLATTFNNQVKETSKEYTRLISETEAKIPSSVSQRNLVGGTSNSWGAYVDITQHNNWNYSLCTLNYGNSTGIYNSTKINLSVFISADNIVLDSNYKPLIYLHSYNVKKDGSGYVWNAETERFYGQFTKTLVAGNNYYWVRASMKTLPNAESLYSAIVPQIRIDGAASGQFHIRGLMVTTGDIMPDYWQAAPEDFATVTAFSDLEQTVNNISGTVSNKLDTSKVSLSADGFVVTSGKTNTDLAKAMGSYFAVNQNAIDLFADKIKVKGSMIVDGAITASKLAAGAVSADKVSGLNGAFIKAKIDNLLVEMLKGKTIVANNNATAIDLLNGQINFNSDEPSIRRITSGIPTQFLKFLKDGTLSRTVIGSNRSGSEQVTDSFAGIVITSELDARTEEVKIISDSVYFSTGVGNNDRGWQMKTIYGEDDRQVLFEPYGTKYQPTKSHIAASDFYRIKPDGTRVNINKFVEYVNQCFAHLQNYTGRKDIWNRFNW